MPQKFKGQEKVKGQFEDGSLHVWKCCNLGWPTESSQIIRASNSWTKENIISMLKTLRTSLDFTVKLFIMF